MSNAHYEHPDANSEIKRLSLLQPCRKHAADEELPLRQIFDDACRDTNGASTLVTFGEIESSMYKRRRMATPNLPANPQGSDAAISGSRFAVIDDAPFYRGEVTTDDGALPRSLVTTS